LPNIKGRGAEGSEWKKKEVTNLPPLLAFFFVVVVVCLFGFEAWMKVRTGPGVDKGDGEDAVGWQLRRKLRGQALAPKLRNRVPGGPIGFCEGRGEKKKRKKKKEKKS
jgi:hypothetical protein